jgi:hypothetical protein
MVVVLKGISDLFARMGRGLQRLSLGASITEEQKNIRLAEQGYMDVGRIILPIDAEQQAATIARSQKALAELQQEHEGLNR